MHWDKRQGKGCCPKRSRYLGIRQGSLQSSVNGFKISQLMFFQTLTVFRNHANVLIAKATTFSLNFP